MNANKVVIPQRLLSFQTQDYGFILGISLTLLALFFLLNFTSAVDNQDRGKQIGIIVVKYNVVQRKGEGQMLWQETSSQYPAYSKDIIRTGKSFLALLRLNNKLEIDMDENSMIVLDLPASGKEAQLQLDYGSLRIRQTKSTSDISSSDTSLASINISSGGKKIHMEGGDVLLSKQSQKELAIAVSKGTAKITTEDGKQALISTQDKVLLQADGLTKQKLEIELKEPADGERLFGAAKQVPVYFSWLAFGKKTRDMRIEISQNSNLSQPVIQRQLKKDNSLTLALEKGVYYWRISTPKAGDSQRNYSNTRKFTVISQEKLRAYTPPINSSIGYRTVEPKISFSWSRNKHAAGYNLEIANDLKFQKIAKRHFTLGNHFIIQLPKGRYYWRVSTQSPKSQAKIYSTTQNFRIFQHKKTSSLKLYTPPLAQKISQKQLAEKGLSFSWQDNPEVHHTQINIASDTKFSKSIITKHTSANFYTLKKSLAPGHYYWKIKTLAKNNDTVATSKVYSFSVTALVQENTDTETLGDNIKQKNLGINKKASRLPDTDTSTSASAGKTKITYSLIKLIKPRKNSSVSHSSVRTEGISFTWRKLRPDGGWDYNIIVAQDRAFKQVVLEKKLSVNQFIAKPKDGMRSEKKYYWKVLAKRKQGERKRAKSKIHSFTIDYLARISIKGKGIVEGRIISRDEKSLTISTSSGIVRIDLNRVGNINLSY